MARAGRTFSGSFSGIPANWISSVVAADDFTLVAGGKRDPGPRVDAPLDEPDRAVAHQDVAAVAVLGVHLVGVAERVVRGVDDHLRMVVDVGAAVAADHVPTAVRVGRPARL